MMFDIHFGDVLGHSIKLYALMTPPAVLSAFLGHTRNYDKQHKHAIAFKTSLSIFIISVVLYVWGAKIFEIFGFTLDAFRIGSGMLLMLAAIDLMKDDGTSTEIKSEGDISVGPRASPLGMGPASIGAVMVMGATIKDMADLLTGLFSLLLAALGMYALLLAADFMGHILHSTGIAVLAKLTGLLLAAIASQVIFTGIKGFLF